MNKIYKSVWNPLLGTYVVASEFAKSKKKCKTVSLMVAASLVMGSAPAFAETLSYTGTEELKTITNDESDKYLGELYPNSTVFGPQKDVNLSGNQVTVNFDPNSNPIPDVIYGALTSVTSDASVSNNVVTFNNGKVLDSVYGGMIYGDRSSAANVRAENNTVNINAGADVNGAFGGRAVALGGGNTSIINNKLNVTGYTSNSGAYFAAAESIATDPIFDHQTGEIISSTDGDVIATGNILTITNSNINSSATVTPGAPNPSYSELVVAYTEGDKVTATDNQLIIKDSTIAADYNYIVGVDSETNSINSNITDNSVSIANSHLSGGTELYTVLSDGNMNSINNNTLSIEGGSVNGGSIISVKSSTGTVDTINGNVFSIKNGQINNTDLVNVTSKGYTHKIRDNQLIVENSRIENSNANNAFDLMTVYVGNRRDGNNTGSTFIENNNLTLKNTTVTNSKNIFTVAVTKKGYAYEVNNNSLDISDSSLSGDNIIITPVFYKATVDTSSTDEGNLKVNITGNKVRLSGNNTFSDGTVIAGAYLDLSNSPTLANDTIAEHYTINHNTVEIDSTSNLSNVNLYGSYIVPPTTPIAPAMLRSVLPNTNNNGDIITGNTLAVHSYSDTVKINSATNFSNYQFYIEGNSIINAPLLTSTDAIQLDYQTTDGSYQSVDLGVTINGKATLKKGDTIQPFSHAEENNLTTYQDGKTITIQKGTGGSYEAVVKLDVDENGNQTFKTEVTSDVKGNDSAKALIEGQSAALAFMNQGADLLATKGLSGAFDATTQAQGDAAGFGAISVGSSRYETGSHVDVDGSSLIVGTAVKKEDLMFGAFFEAGWGDYDSHNSFNSGKVKGDGDTSYRGAGLIARYTFTDNFFVDGSFRIGRTKTSFSSHDLKILGDNVRYDSRAIYYGAHLGAGYTLPIDEKQKLEFTAQYLWTHQNGDSITTATDKYEFDHADSHRGRAIARYNYMPINNLTTYAGLGYEYEFDGESGGTISGIRADTTSLQGSTGIFELGVKSDKLLDSNFYLDVNAKGYVGKREGVQGEFNVVYAF